MIENLHGKVNDGSAQKFEGEMEKVSVSPVVIRNILAFSRALKVEKTKLAGTITHLAN